MPLSRVLARVVHPFAFTGRPAGVRRTVELVRVGFGLTLLHQFVDMHGFVLLKADPGPFAQATLVGAGCGLLIAIGFLTTPALAAWLVLVTVSHPVYLGTQVARLVAWGLLLLGAGGGLSLDARLRERPYFRPLFAVLDAAGHCSPAALAEVRVLLLGLYWAIAASGISFHLNDEFWRKGDVLQVVLTTPYLTDYYAAFMVLRDRWPRLYDVALTSGLAVQAVWQTFLLPLFFVPLRAARAFAVLQGWGFFVVSLLVLNLGYLGAFEVLLWVLLFGYRPGFGLAPPGTGGDGYEGAPAARTAGRIVLGRTVFVAGTLAFALLAAQTLVRFASPERATRFRRVLRETGLSTVPMALFGQAAVNVFNREDLELGGAWVVVLEIDDRGVPLRTVPFLDREGGRLDYLRNDYLYFRWSLPWQRRPVGGKFEEGDLSRPGAATVRLVNGVIDLDVCLGGGSAPRRYRAILASRQLEEGPHFPIWSPPRPGGSFDVHVDGVRAGQIMGRRGPLGCYDLPPGHVASARREADTLRWARALAARLPP